MILAVFLMLLQAVRAIRNLKAVLVDIEVVVHVEINHFKVETYKRNTKFPKLA